MFKFVFPFYYLYYSRLRKPEELLSLIWIYPLFLFLFLFGFYGLELIPNVFSFVLGLIAWMSMYEVGYLENDALTIRREANPNIRIPQRAIEYIQANYKRIFATRVAIFLGLVAVLYISGLLSPEQLLVFLGLVLWARLMFFLHNSTRSSINIGTYFFLCATKYLIFPLVYLGREHGIEPFMVILLSFPLLRTIEHATKKKYGFTKLQTWVGSLDVFRVKYYGFYLGLAIVFHLGTGGGLVFIYSAFYFFLFRLGILSLVGTGKYTRKPTS